MMVCPEIGELLYHPAMAVSMGKMRFQINFGGVHYLKTKLMDGEEIMKWFRMVNHEVWGYTQFLCENILIYL